MEKSNELLSKIYVFEDILSFRVCELFFSLVMNRISTPDLFDVLTFYIFAIFLENRTFLGFRLIS